MPDEEHTQAQDLKDKIKTWENRAEMARKQGNGELVKQALDRKRGYENALAKLQEFEVDNS
jgi:phage shock protein A